MGEFIINEPHHKRYWLPDYKHQFNSVIFGDTLKWSVIEAATSKTVVSGQLNLFDDQWKELHDLAQQLARKHYKFTA